MKMPNTTFDHNSEKIGRPDVRPEALCDVKDPLWRYIAFRQIGEAENEMSKGRFVGTRHLGGHDDSEAVAQKGVAFRK